MKIGLVTYFIVEGVDVPLTVTSVKSDVKFIALDKRACAMEGLIIKFLENESIVLYVLEPCSKITVYCCEYNLKFLQECQARQLFAPVKDPVTGLIKLNS